MVTARWCSACLWLLALWGCATAPTGRYGVREVHVKGADRLAEQAILNCLLTQPHPEIGLTLGIAQESCGEPPFDSSPPRLSLLEDPFADYQGFNSAVIEQDRRRLLRFYEARGFYETEVSAVEVDPPYASQAPEDRPEDACDPEADTCTVDVAFIIEEGEPLHVASVELEGLEELAPELQASLRKQPLPEPGDRFDEAYHDAAKQALSKALAEGGYGQATVSGRIVLQRALKQAKLFYKVEAGLRYRVGDIELVGQGVLPKAPIVAACDIDEEEYYSDTLAGDIQQKVFALGAFSTVNVTPKFDAERGIVDFEVKVSPLPDSDLRFGAGIMSGGQMRISTGDLVSYPQWDVHIFGRNEQRNIFGTLGRIRFEDRPRLIFRDSFPGTSDITLGNVLQVRHVQPAVLERHTLLVNAAQWDVGPDPFLGFGRHNVELRTALERPFFSRRLRLNLALQQDFYIVSTDREPSDGSELPASYEHRFLEEEVYLDLRDKPVDPDGGFYVQLLSRQALRTYAADFTSLHAGFDIRGYIPLPLSMVLATRLTMGFLFIYSAGVSEATTRQLGPSPYRLRGGGANGNRGFLAGELGENGSTGGLRKMESSIELRIRLGQSLGLTLFGDIGNVRVEGPLQPTLSNPTLGAGLRYRTPIGPIRLDMGFLVNAKEGAHTMRYIKVPGALHLTIGESF